MADVKDGHSIPLDGKENPVRVGTISVKQLPYLEGEEFIFRRQHTTARSLRKRCDGVAGVVDAPQVPAGVQTKISTETKPVFSKTNPVFPETKAVFTETKPLFRSFFDAILPGNVVSRVPQAPILKHRKAQQSIAKHEIMRSET